METPKEHANADEQLAKMGYKAELPRNLTMMSILGLYVCPYINLSLGQQA